MTTRPWALGIEGGTFDPLHVGHVAAAEAACDALGLGRVLLIPSHVPPHRAGTRASAFHRFAMASLAAAAHPRLFVSDIELTVPGPSFTAVTLRKLHALGYTASQLFFITGTDAFAEIATWYDYPAVLQLAHFVVISRPGQPFEAVRSRLPDIAARMIPASKTGAAAGVDPLEGPTTRVILVDAPMPDVSSTGIRRRAAAGDSLAGLVAPEVERHIRKYGLYTGGTTIA